MNSLKSILFIWGTLIVAMTLSSCESVPEKGTTFVMKINEIPTKRQQLQSVPAMSLALERGVTREQVKAGRLIYGGCYFEKREEGKTWQQFRHGYVVLPENVNVKKDEVIEIVAEDTNSVPLPYGYFFGQYFKTYLAVESDYFPYKYSTSGKAFKCGEVSPDGKMRMEVYGFAKYWDYDRAYGEETRNKQISDEDLSKKRIAIGVCSPGVDSWTYWKSRIPEGMKLQKGDYVEAVAGATEAPRSRGSLSVILRKVAKPLKEDFILTQGSYTVGCGAKAIPL